MKKFLTIYIIILINMLMGCSRNENIKNITFKDIDSCNNKPHLLISQNNRKIYTYCIENIKVQINDNEINLKNYIIDNDNSIDRIIETLTLDDVYYDGGTKLYKNDDFALISCNTLTGNNDIYIGNNNMKYKENFCKEDNYTFIRTYYIENIEEYKDQQYSENGQAVTYGNSFKVKLKQFNEIEETIIINNLWDIKLEKNKTYEFEFMLYDNVTNIEDSAKYIFENSQIIEVKETNKTGLNQINEIIK